MDRRGFLIGVAGAIVLTRPALAVDWPLPYDPVQVPALHELWQLCQRKQWELRIESFAWPDNAGTQVFVDVFKVKPKSRISMIPADWRAECFVPDRVNNYERSKRECICLRHLDMTADSALYRIDRYPQGYNLWKSFYQYWS